MEYRTYLKTLVDLQPEPRARDLVFSKILKRQQTKPTSEPENRKAKKTYNMGLDETLPLPFRILALVLLAGWLWHATQQITHRYGLNLARLLKLDPKFSQQQYERLLNVSIVAIISYLSYRVLHDTASSSSVSLWDFIPLFIFVWTGYHLCGNRLRTTLKRVLKGGIDRDIRTNDILFSDTLVSFTKVLVDFAIYTCHLIHGVTCLPKVDGSTLDRKCGDEVLLDTFVGSFPTLIRLRQCLTEWQITNDATHLWNFAKYLTNIPLLLVSLLMKQHGGYTNVWIFLAIVNSSYSFYWDVNFDWNLGLFRDGDLRSKLSYPPVCYYAAVLIDFLTRFFWVLRFTPLSPYASEGGWFVLEIVEIARRWLWVLIKVEVDSLSMAKDVEMNEYQD